MFMKLSPKQARRVRQGLLALALLLAALALSGCRTLSYYGQAIKGHYGVVARLQQVEHDRLEAGRAGAGHRDGVMVRGAEHLAQPAHRLVHHLEEIRIEVADERRRHGGEHARIGIGRAGAEQ